jgi:alpha-galactosidase/6-phospho-beta-glucosidase family protein
MDKLAKDPKANVLEVIGTSKPREQQVPIIDALVNDNEGHFQVNVPNNGVIKGLSDDVVVEVPAVINIKGVQTYMAGELPKNIMLNVIYPDWLRMERTLWAFKKGDRAMLLWSLLDNHLTRNYDHALDVLNTVMNIPEYKEMSEYYKWPEKWCSHKL